MRYENIVGRKYGKLTVVEEEHVIKNGRPLYFVRCRCDCGNETVVEKSKVKRGETRSCGCVQKEMRASLGSRSKKPEGEAAFNETYFSYIKSARLRGYDFDLTKEEFRHIVTKPCVYCGEALTQEKKKTSCNGNFKYTGIDRYDNTKGYTVENSVPCCKRCNRIKSDMSINEFEERLEMIIKRKNIWRRPT